MNEMSLKNNKYSSFYENSWESELVAKAKSQGIDQKTVGNVLQWIEEQLLDLGKDISQTKKKELAAKITGPR